MKKLQWRSPCSINHLLNVKKIFEENVQSARKGVTISACENGVLMHGNKEMECNLKDVLFMKNLSCNLMSIAKMEKAGMEID